MIDQIKMIQIDVVHTFQIDNHITMSLLFSEA